MEHVPDFDRGIPNKGPERHRWVAAIAERQHGLIAHRQLLRLGFTREGIARDYLFIDGAWRDHVLTSLTHPRFDRAWLSNPAG